MAELLSKRKTLKKSMWKISKSFEEGKDER